MTKTEGTPALVGSGFQPAAGLRPGALPLALLSLLLLASCGGGEHPTPETTIAPTRVETIETNTAEWPELREAIGTVRARTAAAIQSKVMGYVREVRVNTGDHVRQGQPLISIDSRDLDASLRQAQSAKQEAESAMAEVDNAIAAAKAQLDLAQATFRRMKDLYDKKSISDQEFDEAQARVRTAEASHQMAVSKRAQLQGSIDRASAAVDAAQVIKSYSEISAPFDGTVTAKMVEPGNLAAPGAPLLTIERSGSFRLEASLEESLLPLVRTGQPVAVQLEALGRTLNARVSEVVPAVDAASRAFLVKVDLPSVPQLRSGLFGRLKLETGNRQALVVPASAVRTQGQVQSVFVVNEGRGRARLVKLGERRGEEVEVLTGLAAGERIVHPLPPALVDGAPVEVRP